MHPLIREFKAWTWAERRHVLRTAITPYEYHSENLSLWIRILWLLCFTVYPSYLIGQILKVGHPMRFTFFVVAAGFNIVYWCIFVQLASALRTRIAEERDKIQERMYQLVDAQKQEILNKIRHASGRPNLEMDPISILAATIETTDKMKKEPNPAENPLRAALDGTLRPEHLLPPEDENPDEDWHKNG